jgi:hypothetical protein
VRDPACEKVRTAAESLRIKTKSVSSNPICPPNPAPPVPIAEGALQVPSASRATTIPLPYLAEPRKPALITVRIASPYTSGSALERGVGSRSRQVAELTLAFARIWGGIILSGPND